MRTRPNLPSKSGAFTLIELLIVVAIIGILAAIAVPNFLNAQSRSKIARCQADMRSLATSIEAFRLDRNLMLIDFWDDDKKEGQDRLVNDFNLEQGHNNRGGITGIYVPLTTPTSYMGSIPVDPFAGITGGDKSSGLISEDQYPPVSYLYLDEDPQIPGADGGWLTNFINSDKGREMGWPEPKPGDYYMFGYGPDGIRISGQTGVPYQSSNGLISKGDFFFASNRGFSG